MFIKNVVILFFLNFLFFEISCECVVLPPVSPVEYPYHVFIDSAYWCSGTLISRDYVLTTGSCLNGSTTAISYLGFSRFPFYPANRLENNTRTIPSFQIILHPDFVSLGNFRYENNIGLIRLAYSVVFTLRIQPALLGLNFTVPGKLGDLVSWYEQYLSHAYVRFAAQPTCSRAFQPDYFPDQESCGGWVNGSLEAVGAPVKQNGVIVAQRTDAPCPRPFHVCDHCAVVVNFAPFLDWISEVTGISVEQLTGVIPPIPCCERVEIAQGQIIQSLNNLTVWSQSISQRNDRRDRALEWFKSGSNSSCFP